MAYLSKRVLGVGAYSGRGGGGGGLFESGGIFIQVNSRVGENKIYLFILYFRRIIFYVNKIIFLCQYHLYSKSYIP